MYSNDLVYVGHVGNIFVRIPVLGCGLFEASRFFNLIECTVRISESHNEKDNDDIVQ